MLVVFRICSMSFSSRIRFHDRENRAKKGGICVANHTSPIDVMILSCDNCYALIGQQQPGFLGILSLVQYFNYSINSRLPSKHIVQIRESYLVREKWSRRSKESNAATSRTRWRRGEVANNHISRRNLHQQHICYDVQEGIFRSTTVRIERNAISLSLSDRFDDLPDRDEVWQPADGRVLE